MSNRTRAILGVLAIGPLAPLILIVLVAPLVALLNEGYGWLVAIIGIFWTFVWCVRNGKRWLQMLRLAARGTPPELLDIAAHVLETWPSLIAANGWVPRTALGHEPGANQKIWALISGNRSALGPKILGIADAPAGPVVEVALTPACGADRLAGASESIADVWGAQRVEVTRPRPGVARLCLRTRDPLAGTGSYKPQAPQSPYGPPPSADDFLIS